ncbi:hypothetical protein BT69DRAFT_379 [Atractiella rhizophila]|nr:hypothetical protein BT69DRAFT_379 [Atractiella rhizophila]
MISSLPSSCLFASSQDVDFQDKCGKTWRVASNITSAGRDENIVGYYGIPLPCDFPGYPSAGVGSGNIQVIITEHQIGQHGRVSFRAAAPTFQPTVFSGDECATLAGACGNTDEWMLP